MSFKLNCVETFEMQSEQIAFILMLNKYVIP